MADAEDSDDAVGEAPARATVVLAALILVAGVANLNLSVANVALPDIGKHFDSSQTTLDLIAVGYSLGLYAEQLDADTGRHLGNFPQAFSHLACLEAGARIIMAERLRESTS